MTGESGFTTVYRSADMNASEDATGVKNVLLNHGLDPVLLDDTAPGVVPGTFEVRVPADQVSQAEAVISTIDQDDPGRADPSRDLDMVTIWEGMGATGEVEALGIKGILDANGISHFMAGSSTMPNLSFSIGVPKADLERARQAISEAEAAGPAAAIEAERQSEEFPPQT